MAAPRARRRRPDRRRGSTTCTTRSSIRAGTARRSTSSGSTTRTCSPPTCASGCSTASTTAPTPSVDVDDPLRRDRLRLRDDRAARAPARRDDARHPAAPRRAVPAPDDARRRPATPTSRARSRWRAATFDDRHRRRAVGVRQRATRPRGVGRTVPHRPHAGHEPRVPRVRRQPAATATTRRGARRGEPGATKPGSSTPSSGGRDPTAPGAGGGSVTGRRCHPTSPCSTSAGTRPTRSRVAPASGSRPRPSGSTRRRGTRHAAEARATLGRRARRRRPRQPRRRPASAPTPSAATPTGVSAVGLSPDARRRVGVDRHRSSPGTRASAAFPYREYSEVFFDDGYRVLRGGSWATDPSAVRTTFRNWDLPDPPPDLRRLPLRAR